MLTSTLKRLRCICGSSLALDAREQTRVDGDLHEVKSGSLSCPGCGAAYWIIAGVAMIVEDTHGYLVEHVKGVSKVVPEDEIPELFRDDFIEAKAEIQTEHIEEDLEAERVTALYLMNHYLSADEVDGGAVADPLISELIRKYWSRGPFSCLREWVGQSERFDAAVELGCGVGGLARIVSENCDYYLGVDSSFASVAIARHLNLGGPYPGELRFPGDLIHGPVSRPARIGRLEANGHMDFVVAEMQNPPLAMGEWDLAVSLNAIDMLDEPASLPALQGRLLRGNGTAIQSAPYIWHESVASRLRSSLPPELHDSARAVEELYRREGFVIDQARDHIPWLFFKHLRQLEIYSVHMIHARKPS